MKLRCRWFGHKYYYGLVANGHVCFCERCGASPWNVTTKTKKDYIHNGAVRWLLSKEYYNDL